MNRRKKTEKLSALIVKFGKGKISQDEADLAAYEYFSEITFWDMIRPDLIRVNNTGSTGLKDAHTRSCSLMAIMRTSTGLMDIQ